MVENQSMLKTMLKLFFFSRDVLDSIYK